MSGDGEPYLQPYLKAAARHGAKFESLLWASPRTQAARFAALTRACDFDGRNVLDVGCGRGDLLDYLIDQRMRPSHYVGIEAVRTSIEAARARHHRDSIMVEADFVREPSRMLVGADVVVFCGSLNTLDAPTFYQTLSIAYEAAAETLVFNFLSTAHLASAPWLTWHHPDEVAAFARGLALQVTKLDDYLQGDCTMAMKK